MALWVYGLLKWLLIHKSEFPFVYCCKQTSPIKNSFHYEKTYRKNQIYTSLGSGNIKKLPLEGGKTSSLASATKELELTSTENVLYQKEILLQL